MNLREGILFALEHGPHKRSEIVWILGRPRTTVYDALRKLFVEGKVGSYSVPNGVGRPITMWELKENGLEVVVEK